MPWQKVLLQFYREFPIVLDDVRSEDASAGSPDFELWKVMGDELLYTCSVSSEQEIDTAIAVWIRAMRRYERKHLSDEGLKLLGAPRLGVKGAAFVGTFPGPDNEASIPRRVEVELDRITDVVELDRMTLAARRREADYFYDYFGPSIDTGFRIIGQSDARFFAVSVEVAMALAAVRIDCGSTGFEDALCYRGSVSLKGVWGGHDYPLLALDLGRWAPVNSEVVAFDESKYSVEKILALCIACYESVDWPFMLYLPGSSGFGDVPDLKVVPEHSMRGYVPVPRARGFTEKAMRESKRAIDVPADVLEDDSPA
jgi:hypothetical protein